MGSADIDQIVTCMLCSHGGRPSSILTPQAYNDLETKQLREPTDP